MIKGYWILGVLTICPNRIWFHKFESAQGRVVLMDNDVTYKVARTGAVKVRMPNSVVRTLSDVRHVLDMTKNLISLSSLDCNGYQCVIEDGTLRVIKGDFKAIKGK